MSATNSSNDGISTESAIHVATLPTVKGTGLQSKRNILAMLAIGVAVAITFLLLSYDDLTTELYYPSFAEANTGDARTDHWIPPVLQESSTDIHVVYGIDPSFLRVSLRKVRSIQKG